MLTHFEDSSRSMAENMPKRYFVFYLEFSISNRGQKDLPVALKQISLVI